MNGDWRFENKNIYKVINLMSPDERKEFQADCRVINWSKFVNDYAVGIAIWVLKENKVEPIHGLDQIINKNKEKFDDIYATVATKKNFKNKNS